MKTRPLELTSIAQLAAPHVFPYALAQATGGGDADPHIFAGVGDGPSPSACRFGGRREGDLVPLFRSSS
jgi:hypothetical protein